MFNKGLVIVNAFTLWKETGHMVDRLKEEFAHYGVAIDGIRNDLITAYIDSDGNPACNVHGYDFIIYLDKDYYIGTLLEKCGYRLFNHASAVHDCDDKMLTHLRLTGQGIKMPKTISYPLRFGPGEDTPFVDRVIKELGFPMIVKHCYGSLGEQVYLVKNRDDLLTLVAKIRDIPHLYQEYIPSTFGTDLRVVLVNHKVVAAMKRVAQTKDEFRSNIETGGVGLEVEVPEAYAKVAIKATEVMDLDYCGLDLLFGPNGEPILCEVNSNAYFGPIEKYSGKNVAKPYTEHVIEEIYGKSRLN